MIESLVFNTLLGLTREVVAEAMPHRAWNAKTWSKLADELDQFAPIASAIRSLRMERVLQMRVLSYTQMLWPYSGSSTTRSIAAAILPRGWRAADNAATSLQTQRFIEGLFQPESLPTLSSEIVRQSEKYSIWDSLRTPLVRQHPQPLTNVCQAAIAGETLLRCTSTSCKLLAHLASNSPPPKSASDLEILIGSPLPKDPLSGNALLYRMEGPNTFAMYGTGWNQKDDEGQDLFTPALKAKTMSLNQRKDLGIRIQLPPIPATTP
jgi:hypothetical protein